MTAGGLAVAADEGDAGDLDFARRQLLEDGEHQLLLAHGRGVLDLIFLSESEQFSGRFGLELAELQIFHTVDDPGELRFLGGMHRARFRRAACAWSMRRLR